ncbi:MAG: sulfite exporter TauE/SafE family protein, partial [Chloroflexi bacterium]|nr:sulfite exporter TauE/SafE family protein [Chloroflexota bacterium]
MTLIAYVLVGLVIGILSGIFGVGGSSISTPVLRLALGVPPLIALATPLPVTIPTAIAGGLAYYRRGLVNWNIVIWCTLSGIPGVIAGAIATKYISGHWLMILTGIVVLGIGVRIAWSAISSLTVGDGNHHSVSGQDDRSLLLLIGLSVGFFSGLLANGGGFLLVPAFILLLGLSMHEAAGTSLVCIAGFAIPGTITHWLLGHIDPILMLSLGVAVIPASYVGARVALRLKSSQVQLLFGIFLFLFSAYFIYSEAR